ncbi:putative uncharacterized protein MSANTD5 [Peromyscus californicus insignis]|uniref:putative uncharacterized protein MSANTD5 n=1 Tax=Peromyscus californicus insignis TaxID=564181 RepID=UPI0022A7DF50|nr:putative uncharacterized protein MSANTD5 [Peromyscus californicus insignis]
MAGPSCTHPWSETEIRIFLQEWKVVEGIIGHPGSKIYQKSWALYQRVNGHRGLKKSWESCVDLLLTLQNLHRRLCNGRGDTIPLFSPFSEDLYSILGHAPSNGCDENLSVSPNKIDLRIRPWYYGIPVPSAELQGNPSPMMSREDSLVPR